PSSVTTIESAAFNSCTALTSITIPDTVTSIANDAFGNCDNLQTINYNGPAEGRPWNE
ncbi:MAG: leucine-rich repeat protein, partial [Clostridiales bacterium]|nr:leucine-rich repeat protein [Clostridiales bacterium]